MGELHQYIDEHLSDFIERQHVFFVATAPLDTHGHINLSPKGMDTFRILGPQAVAYLDFVGSGVETIAHLRENRRIVIMFCALEGPPRIVRLHGDGSVLEPQDEEFVSLMPRFPAATGVRSIIRVELGRLSDSCGFGVPMYQYEGARSQLAAWCERKGTEGLLRYQRDNNAVSIDGLPGLRWTGGE